VALDRGITNGQMVVFVPLASNSDWEPFVRFSATTNYRPIDVTVGPDGALYILEWQNAAVYRVSYTGEAILPTPAATALDPIPTFIPAKIAAGEALFRNGAPGAPPCITCHSLDGRAGLGPSLLGLRDAAPQRAPGLSAVEYVRQSITTPNAYIVSGYNSDYMYQRYGETLTDDQIEALTAFVLSLEK
jgi:mono/diheme cytochrome c family protein